MSTARLQNRCFILVSGADAETFLQGIITTDLSLVGQGEAWPGALLTPQGKIMFDFLVGRREDGWLLETDAAHAEPLTRRLTLYRLRAKATFETLAANATALEWGEGDADGGMVDQRFQRAGITLRRTAVSGGADDAADDASEYRRLRFAAAIAGGGEDGALGDYFPHDLLMDRNGGLSFKKGCYIGQEVVSRIQHRATARRRLVSVSGLGTSCEPGMPVLAGDRDIGTLLGAEGDVGIAVVRIDKAGAAIQAGVNITVDRQPVSLALPGWSGLEFPTEADEAAS